MDGSKGPFAKFTAPPVFAELDHAIITHDLFLHKVVPDSISYMLILMRELSLYKLFPTTLQLSLSHPL